MKVFAYIRVSTEEQAVRGNSLFEQQERLIKYSKDVFGVEPELFIDEGASAKNLNRKKLTLMLERVKLGGPGIVITSKLDRLSRSLRDTLNLIDFFEDHRFKFVTESERFDTTTPEGMMSVQQLGAFAEFERSRIAERVLINMQSIARNSKKAIARPCFGYDIIDGEYVQNIEESLILRQMFEWALLGEGPLKIVERLNKLGIRTKSKNLWSERTVRLLMRRDTLIGRFTYNKTYRKGKKVYTRPPEEWIHSDDHHAPIIDEETFYRVAEIFEGRKQVGRRVSEDTYLLSGLLRCTHCGSTMCGKSTRTLLKKTGDYQYYYQYVCNGYTKKRICFAHKVKRDDLENLIRDRISSVVHNDPASLQLEIAKKEGMDINIDFIEKQMAKLDAQIQKQIEAYSEELITAADLKAATKRVEEKRTELRAMLDEATASGTAAQQAKIKEKATRLIEDVRSDDRLKTKRAIYQLIEKIEITDGTDVRITWRGY